MPRRSQSTTTPTSSARHSAETESHRAGAAQPRHTPHAPPDRHQPPCCSVSRSRKYGTALASRAPPIGVSARRHNAACAAASGNAAPGSVSSHSSPRKPSRTSVAANALAAPMATAATKQRTCHRSRRTAGLCRCTGSTGASSTLMLIGSPKNRSCPVLLSTPSHAHIDAHQDAAARAGVVRQATSTFGNSPARLYRASRSSSARFRSTPQR